MKKKLSGNKKIIEVFEAGKKSVHCKKCGNNFLTDKYPEICPFCKSRNLIFELSEKDKLKQLEQEISQLKSQTAEKQKKTDQLKMNLEKEGLINKIDTLTKDKPEPIIKKQEDSKIIIIECSGGLVDDVKGLPEGYTYDIHDYDNEGICKICGDKVVEWEFREHLESHNPNAKKLKGNDLYDFFEEVY